MLGTRLYKKQFMIGYDAFLEHINPEGIICLDKPYREMRGNILYVPYEYPKQKLSTQLWLPFMDNPLAANNVICSI